MPALGQEEAPALRGPRVFALTGARIVVAPGRVLDSATLVVREGIIEAVGPAVAVPPEARVRDLSGKTLYAGLIESYWPRIEPKESPAADGDSDPRVHPEREVAAWEWPASDVRDLRQAGFTTALAVPADGVFRGQSALLNLGDGSRRENLLRSQVAQHLGLQRRGRRQPGYGNSAMGTVALLRQRILDARWAAAAGEAWRRHPQGIRPPRDRSLEALLPVAEGRQTAVFEARSLNELLRAGRLSRELSLQAVLLASGFEYQRLDDVVELGQPLILPLAFPETPKAPAAKTLPAQTLPAQTAAAKAAASKTSAAKTSAPGSVGPETGGAGDDDRTLSLEALRHWDQAPDNPAALVGAGARIALTTHGLDGPKDFYPHLARALERGLTPDQALAALTTTPARLWGIEALAGTLEAGKLANFLVVEGELFTEQPKIREVWVDGRPFPLGEAEAPKIDPRGSWTLHALIGEGAGLTLRLQLEGEPSALRGDIRLEEGGNPIPVVAETQGPVLELRFPGLDLGLDGEVRLTLEIRDDQAKGHGRGAEGDFAAQGSRAPALSEGPPPEEPLLETLPLEGPPEDPLPEGPPPEPPLPEADR